MIPARVSLVTLGVRDMGLLRRFYRSLGWQETDTSSDSYAVFRTAGVILSLFPLEELAKDAGLPMPEPAEAFRGVTLAINLDQPDGVDRAMAVAEAAGATILRRPSDAFWGGRTAYFMDPERNVWEVAWNPTAVFDERGGMISF